MMKALRIIVVLLLIGLCCYAFIKGQHYIKEIVFNTVEANPEVKKILQSLHMEDIPSFAMYDVPLIILGFLLAVTRSGVVYMSGAVLLLILLATNVYFYISSQANPTKENVEMWYITFSIIWNYFSYLVLPAALFVSLLETITEANDEYKYYNYY